ERAKLETLISGKSDSTKRSATRLRIEPSKNTIYLRITAPVVTPDFILLQTDTSTLDFGTVPIGQHFTRSLTFRNASGRPLRLQIKGLSPAGPFRVVKTLRESLPDGELTIKLTYNPTDESPSDEEYTLYTQTTLIPIKLAGTG